MMKHTRLLLAIPLIPSLLAVFSSGAVAQNRGPDLIFLDSLVLEETDEHYIGNPLALFVAPDGSLLVSDGCAETVLRYDATGRLVGKWGGRGGGPGEFGHLGGVGFVTATVAGFLDETGKLELFALATDAHSGSVRVDVNNRPSSFAVRGDSLWFAGINPVSSATYGAIRPRAVHGYGPMRALFGCALAIVLSFGRADAQSGTIVYGWVASLDVEAPGEMAAVREVFLQHFVRPMPT